MVNFLVAVDNSAYAKAAFWTAIYSIKDNSDTHVYILNVVEAIRSSVPFFSVPASTQEIFQEKAKQASRNLLHYYGNLAKAAKVNFTCIMAISNHVPEMICHQVTDKKISFLYLGKRGTSLLQRLFMGSTSRYCTENADCNVVVVKGEWGPSVIHEMSKEDVIAAEERERQRRIGEEKAEEAKEKFESSLDLNIARLAEETERMARISEEKFAKDKEIREREAAHIGAVIDEENERKRRMREDAIIDDRQHKMEIFEHVFTPSD